MNLNEEQKKAVYCESNRIVCVAGAGSGKTECMLRRVEQLVKSGVNANSILILTFTRNASLDMKTRYFTEYEDHSVSPYFCTFHSFCYRLLIKDSSIRQKLGYINVPDILEDWQEKEYHKLAKTLSGMKFNPDTKRDLSVKEQCQLTDYYTQLNKLIISNNKITYDILSNSICELFQNDDVVIQQYKYKYKYIFVDEFQDTDIHQWDFVQSFKNSSIYVCGDALQNLYSFRGTTNEILKSLTKNPEWTTIKIKENYRSGTDIVTIANANSTYASENYRIEMTPAHKFKGCVDVTYIPERKKNSNYLQDVEVSYLENSLKSDMNNYEGTFALLARTNSEVNYIESVLLSNEIDYNDTSYKDDTDKYLNCINDNTFEIEWLSSCIPSTRYDRFMQKSVLDSYTLDEFIVEFEDIFDIKYRYDIIEELRDTLDTQYSTTFIFENIERILHINIDETNLPPGLMNRNEMISYILDNYTLSDKGSSLFVGTIHSVKGLEFDSVVLFGVNDIAFKLDNEDNKNLYYVGMTRAKNYLKVFKYAD